MFLPTLSIRRRGNVLIVTMLLLALFAIVAVTMVFYATSVANRARIVAEVQNTDSTFPDDGQATLNSFVGQMLFPNSNTGTAIYSSLRNQDLTTIMYGGQAGNTVPFNGIGLFSENATTAGINRRQMMNYKYFGVNGQSVIYDREFTGERSPTVNATGSIVGCNAPYTYADGNNQFLAVLCPATGEVLVPSFYRKQAFGALNPPGTAGANPNWTNKEGKYLLLRPRPQEHPQFPYPAQNADGSWTGDVKNLDGAPGGNDSIWIDIGMPVITLADGRRVKPLVAALIVDLDGLLSLSVHGNRLRAVGPPAPPSPNDLVHASGPGLGPWDVNLERVLPNGEARYIIAARGQARTQGGVLSKSFARLPAGGQLPAYAPVPWYGYDGLPGAALQYPSAMSLYKGTPDFGHGYDPTNAAVTFHPSLFNPTEWPTTIGSNPRSFPPSDTKLLHLKYAAAPSAYLALDVGTQGQPASSLRPLGGTFTVPNPNPPGAVTQNNYRTDPNHQNRFLFTTTPNYSLDLPGLMPNYLNQTTGTALARDPATGLLINPSTLLQFPAPQTPGTITDFGNWTNVRAMLGAIDMNRTLADYRGDTTQPLAPNNMGNELLARLDRQRFARDIFARLVVATGAQAQVATAVITIGATVYNVGDVYTSAVPGSPEFNALRALAQIAVNIVDYIDSDDVSTPFVFQPINPQSPQDPLNFTPTAPDVLGNHVVFGVEKPRVVLSEAYAEVCNDPKDTSGTNKASNPTQVRFWFELQNPTGQLAGSPMGNGAANLYYAGAFNPYRVEIVQNGKGGGNVSTLLRNPTDPNNAANVKGDIYPPGQPPLPPDLQFNFLNAAAPVPPANGLPGSGIVVCSAAALTAQSGAQEFNPPAFAGGITGAALGQPDALTYPYPLNKALNGTSLAPILKNHVVVLRRLANPYLPESNSNPYITVDFIDSVSTFDAILRADGTNTDRSAKTWTGAAVNPGYDPITPASVAGDPIVRRHSLGKVQPYAGYSFATPAGANQEYPSFTFPNSLVLAQVVFNANTQAQGVQQTLGYQNSRTTTAPVAATYVPAIGATPASLAGGETLMAPYDWLVHLDRPLINQLELLHVTAGKPHELTNQFIVPTNPIAGTGKDVQKNAGTVQWLPTVAPHPYANANPNGLLRAFDLLRIQPYGQQTPFGGLVAGRININTIQDKRVWDALFDALPPPQANNYAFTQAQVDKMWNAMMSSRTPDMRKMFNAAGNQIIDATPNLQLTPFPGASIYDSNSAVGDRPFLPFSAPQLAQGSGFAFGGAGGIDDTILRRSPGTNTPMLFNVQSPPLHPYQQAEAAQKVLNNFTTVSNNFAVWLTVGYFEVDPTPIASGFPGVVPDEDRLGKEYYREVPGDTRHRFFSIIDRSQIAMDAASYVAGTYTPPTTAPYFTTVEANAAATTQTLQIYAPGGQVFVKGLPVTVGGTIAIGVGANREFATISTVNFAANGISTLGLAAPLSRDHAIGECVSNAVPGNPGPQPGFDLADPRFATVVPHTSRVQ